jgi:DNA processing protein
MHPLRVQALYAEYGPEAALQRLRKGVEKTTERIRAAVSIPAGKRRSQLRAAGIAVVFKGEADYPESLAGLPDGPDLLFVRGTLPAAPGVAVVGSRRCTSYGRSLAERYGRAIASAGWPLVSGLARGIDGAAHRGTVGGGGVGVAVLGSGIDVMYPREHADLARQILDRGGAVVSESPPGTPPEAWRFPVRNRVIAGMAAALVVVEATVKGGALITVEAALRYGRQVFAVPGDVGRPSSEGCNLLIRDGAFPVTSPDDLVESLELVLGPAPGASCPSPSAVVDPGDRPLLALIAAGARTTDELLEELDEPVPAAVARIGRLELDGVITSDKAGFYDLA